MFINISFYDLYFLLKNHYNFNLNKKQIEAIDSYWIRNEEAANKLGNTIYNLYNGWHEDYYPSWAYKKLAGEKELKEKIEKIANKHSINLDKDIFKTCKFPQIIEDEMLKLFYYTQYFFCTESKMITKKLFKLK